MHPATGWNRGRGWSCRKRNDGKYEGRSTKDKGIAGVKSRAIAAALFALFVLLIGISGAGFSAMQSTLTYSVAPPNMRSRLFGLIVLCIGTGLFGVFNIGFVAEWFDGATSVRIVAVEGLVALVAIGIGWQQLWSRQYP